MSDYDEVVTEALDELMMQYECDNPLDAMLAYFIDYCNMLIEEAEESGQDIDEVLEKAKREAVQFELECCTNPEKALVNNRILKMLSDYNEEKKQQ
jgi:hypothetical protein